MRTLLIDNYDSYTYNLFQVIAEVNGELPLVYYNDEITLDHIQSMVQAGTVHNIVISPGPGTPNNPHDIGVCLEVLQQLTDVPILGICLGHQALALAHGGAVISAPEPVHGRLSCLRHNGHGLFRDIPSGSGFAVVRYHSLLVSEASLPECLEPVCWTTGAHAAVKLARDESDSGPAPASAAAQEPSSLPSASGGSTAADTGLQHHHLELSSQRTQPKDTAEPHQEQQRIEVAPQASLLMGLAHRSRPHYGVQFHPESVATRFGIALLRNFRDLSIQHIRKRGGLAAAQLSESPRVVDDIVGPPGRLTTLPPWPSPEHQRGARIMLSWERLGGLLKRLPEPGSQAIFEHLFGWAQDTFWLDSAAADRGRFSYMGGRGGALWRKFTYKLPEPHAESQWHPHQPQQLEAQQQHQEVQEKDPKQQEQQQACDQDNDAASSSGSSAACCGGSAGDPESTTGASSMLSVSAGPSELVPPHAPTSGAACVGVLTTEDAAGNVTRALARGGFLGFLEQLLARQRLLVESEAAAQLPFNFWGGLVGYLGYELKAECGAANAHAARTPDAVMFLADRMVAVDHAEGDVFLLALYDPDDAGGDDGDGNGDDGCPGTGAAHTGGGEAGCAEPSSGGSSGRSGGNCGSTAAARAAGWLQTTRQALETLVESAGKATSAAAGSPDGASTASRCSARHMLGAAAQEGAMSWLNGRPLQEPSRCCPSAPVANTSGEPPSTRPRPACGPEPAAAPAGHSVAEVPADPPAVPFRLEHSREAYLRNIAACHAALHAGESYEVCLTTALARPAAPDPPALYRLLRQLNPAPYAAWLQCGTNGPTICCSSPERFLHGDRGALLEARPIKGTAARVPSDPTADAVAAAELAASEKERAENLMIVDLLRNDLGRVCEVGSVHVPGLMDIESYATVHQMVSTVRGVRRRGMSVVDCIRAAFPGGSMTGAPKVRTMQIIDGLEGRARGVYSGCIGFISLNDTFDLNIVIRTAVIEEGAPPEGRAAGAPGATREDGTTVKAGRSMTIGAGGAIVVQSQPEAEYEEMRLKARALLRAVGLCEGRVWPVSVLAD